MKLNEDLEQIIFTIRPTMIFIKLGYALAVLGRFALVLLLAWIDVPAVISVPIALRSCWCRVLPSQAQLWCAITD